MKFIKVTWIVTLCSTFLWGCGQGNLKREGMGYLDQGRYEQAVRAYQQVLAKKPKDEESRLKLVQAQQGLDNWVSKIKSSADAYYKVGEYGKAIFLYGKVAQITKDPQAVDRYKKSLSILKDQYELVAKLSYPRSIFGSGVGDGLEGLTLVRSGNANKSNFWNISFKRDPLKIDKTVDEIQEVQQYIIGYETIANPDHAEALLDIDDQELVIDRAMQSLDAKRSRELELRRSLSDAQKDLEIVQLKLNYESPGSSQYSAISQQVGQQKRRVEKVEKDIRRVERDIRSAQNKVTSERNEKSRLTDRLRDIPPTAQQAIYADYPYSRFVERQVASAQLVVNRNGNHEKFYVESVHEDFGHDAHGKIKLAAKRPILKTRGEFERLINSQMRAEAEKYLTVEIAEYKNQFLRQSQSANDPNKRFELLAIHSLAGVDGVSSDVAQEMKTKLEAEFGVGGIFDVNRLIALF